MFCHVNIIVKNLIMLKIELQLIFNTLLVILIQVSFTSSFWNTHIYTVPYQKYSYPTKYPCSDCAIYRLNTQFGAKMEIEIYRYQKFVVLALNLGGNFLFFRHSMRC